MSDTNEILDKYNISQEQMDEIFNKVIQNLSFNIKPVKNPVAVIVGGQCGSGKSGLMAYSHKMFSSRPHSSFDNNAEVEDEWIEDNVVQIEDDEFRAYFPDEKKIAIEHPEEYTQITNKLTNELTARVLEYFMKNKYNIILHQTLKNNRVADDAIVKLRDNGYAIVVRALAVNEFESMMSMIERSLGQIEIKGYCRTVTASDHDRTYSGMPGTLQYIDDNNRFDILQVFKRGKKNDEPILVHNKINPDTKHLSLLSTFPYLITDVEPRYKTAREALEETREQGAAEFLVSAEDRINVAKRHKDSAFVGGLITDLEERIANKAQAPKFN